MKINLKEKLGNYRRVLSIAKKPTLENFLESVRKCAIGMILIGSIGFLIYLVFVLFIG